MRTKLVYVLTCTQNKYYIEQALMSVYSARYWNPDAHIVLIVDDLTDRLLTGKRAEVLQYLSEKVVVPFEDESLTAVYRSRWIKTSVRQLVEGDFLFIDCDTIVCQSLHDVDGFDCSMGAVWESHLLVSQFCDSLLHSAKEATEKVGVDIETEGEYFSSGVLYVKDVEETRRIYALWHQYWLDGQKAGLRIDQPSLAKANREMGHLIKRIPDTYNCILFTRNTFTEDAFILHIAAYRNPSLLFVDKTLALVKESGLANAWLKDAIQHPCSSFLPFDYDILHSSGRQRRLWIQERSAFLKGYGEYVDAAFVDFPRNGRVDSLVVWLLKRKCACVALKIWMSWKRIYVWRKRIYLLPNICANGLFK